MVGKQLSALLQILRAQGVTRYQTPDLTLELGPAPVKHAPKAIGVLEPGPDDDEKEPEDYRFALERLQRKHYPAVKADPRRNGQ